MPLDEAQIPNKESGEKPLEVSVFFIELVQAELFDAVLKRARDIYSERQNIPFIQLVLILYTTILMGCTPILPTPLPDISEKPQSVSLPHELPQAKPELIKFSTIESATNVDQVEKFRDEVEQMIPPEEYITSIFKQISEMSVEEVKVISVPVPIEGAYFQQMEISVSFVNYVIGVEALTSLDATTKEDFATKSIKLKVGLDIDAYRDKMTNAEKLLVVKHELTHVLQLTAMLDQAVKVMLRQQVSNGWQESELIGTDPFYVAANAYYQLINSGMKKRCEVVPYLQLNLDYQKLPQETKDRMTVDAGYVEAWWNGRAFNAVYGEFLATHPDAVAQDLINQDELYAEFKKMITDN